MRQREKHVLSPTEGEFRIALKISEIKSKIRACTVFCAVRRWEVKMQG